MAIAIAMETGGYTYKELEETPDSILKARNLFKKFVNANRREFNE